VLAPIVSGAGLGASPLVIVGVVVAYLVTLGLAARKAPPEQAATQTGTKRAGSARGF
jgi:hypothetical protein